jgi:hypothetical protein
VKPQVGATLGDRYVLAAELGERPGVVEYRAFDKEVEVEVSLWWIRPELVADAARGDALLGAGVELRGMHDLALRKCFGVGRGREGVWATWQLAGGAGLLPGAEPVALAQLRRWIDAVARALEALHGHGLVHGRMTPHDVVTIGGALKLGGGGLWRDVDPAAAARAWSGNDHYVAPEVRRNQPPTEASDAWSMAMIALELVAGMSGAHPDAPRAAARRHPQLAAVLVGAMNPDPAQRPTIAALAEAARNASEYPYVEMAAQPLGKGGNMRGGDASTLLGHAAHDEPVPRRAGTTDPPRRKRSTTPATLRSTKQTQAAAAAAVRLPPAPKPPSPSAQRPIVVAPPPKGSLPTPARHAIADAVDRARPPRRARMSSRRSRSRRAPAPRRSRTTSRRSRSPTARCRPSRRRRRPSRRSPTARPARRPRCRRRRSVRSRRCRAVAPSASRRARWATSRRRSRPVG